MRKLRITKITVKTRETFSVKKASAEENDFSHCPVCYAPINKVIPEIIENSIKKLDNGTKGEK